MQLWVALPEAHRETEPAFDRHALLLSVDLEGGRATVIPGEMAGVRSTARTFSPIVGADLAAEPGALLVVPLDPGFEHALVMLRGVAALDGQTLVADTLYGLGRGRRELRLRCHGERPRALLLGGAPFGETILMWWNFVARTTEEIVAAREDWQAGRRFGAVAGYRGEPLEAPPLLARPVPRP